MQITSYCPIAKIMLFPQSLLKRQELVVVLQFLSQYYCFLVISMEEERIEVQEKKPQIMEEEYNSDHQNDIFQNILGEGAIDHFMEIEKIQKPIHYRSTKNLISRKSDFRKILNSSSSNDRLFPTSINNDSSRQNSEKERDKLEHEHSVGSQSFRRSFIKKLEESFSVSHTVRDSSSSFSERSDSKSSHNIIIPQVYKEEADDQFITEKKLGCNCKRSRCLKLYCQCFQKQLFCSKQCNCHSCGNHTGNKEQHQQAVINALARNVHGFLDENKDNETDAKGFSLGVQPETVRKGCKCKKTKCLKKYCECYQGGYQCTVFCRCEGCFNNKQFVHNLDNRPLSQNHANQGKII